MNIWLFRLVWLGAVLGLAGAVNWFFGLNFWFVAILIGGGLVLNGLLAEWEDNQPGGYNNPREKSEK